MAFLTNMIVDGIGEDCSGGEGPLTQTLLKIFSHTGGIFEFCQTFPALRFFISPPSVRNKPGVLDPDGIHFNIMSGINYVQDLHDQAVQLSLMPPPDPKLR